MLDEARPLQQDSDASSHRKYNTYEELRQQNRQDYERHRRVPTAQPASQPEQSSPRYPPHQDPHPPAQPSPRQYTANRLQLVLMTQKIACNCVLVVTELFNINTNDFWRKQSCSL